MLGFEPLASGPVSGGTEEATLIQYAFAHFNGSGSLSAAVRQTEQIRARLDGSSALVARGILHEVISVALNGSGSVFVSEHVPTRFYIGAIFNGRGSMRIQPPPLQMVSVFPRGVSFPKKKVHLKPRRADSFTEVTPDKHLRRTGDDYAQSWMSLLPQGIAWPRDPDRVLGKTIRGLAQIWGLVDKRAADLLEIETDPRLTIEMLTDWERAFGLPDPCFREATTVAERQKQLVMKMTMMGGQSREFFIGVASWLGYQVSIEEYAPFMCGVSRVGDTRDPKDVNVKDSDILAPYVTSRDFGTTTVEKRGQNFIPSANVTSLRSVDCVLSKVGGPTDDLVAKVYYTDSDGYPGDACLATSDKLSSWLLSGSPAPHSFVFAPPIILAESTKYAIMLQRTGSLDDSNYYRVGST